MSGNGLWNEVGQWCRSVAAGFLHDSVLSTALLIADRKASDIEHTLVTRSHHWWLSETHRWWCKNTKFTLKKQLLKDGDHKVWRWRLYSYLYELSLFPSPLDVIHTSSSLTYEVKTLLCVDVFSSQEWEMCTITCSWRLVSADKWRRLPACSAPHGVTVRGNGSALFCLNWCYYFVLPRLHVHLLLLCLPRWRDRFSF